MESATSGETCPDAGAGGEPPRRPEGGGGGGAGNGAGLLVVGFVCLSVSFLRLRIGLSARPHLPLHPRSPLCARPQAGAVSQSEFGEVWEPEGLQGLAVAERGQEFYLAFELPEEIQLEPV